MRAITEAQHLEKDWYEQAKSMTLGELPQFLNHLLVDYRHDYGTICKAIAAGAVATAWAMDHSEQGGITGFQGGAVMWEFIRAWSYSSNKAGLKLLDFDKLLYPQYADSFSNVISVECWKKVQELAQTNIDNHRAAKNKYLVDKLDYDSQLASFVQKYPDYYDRKDHYDHRVMGTGDEWALEKQKEESGFEFAPKEPYKPTVAASVMMHWLKIVEGKLPFGFQIGDD